MDIKSTPKNYDNEMVLFLDTFLSVQPFPGSNRANPPQYENNVSLFLLRMWLDMLRHLIH